MRPVDRHMVRVTERRDGEIDRRNRAVLPHLGFRVFDRPTRRDASARASLACPSSPLECGRP
jgi:hypothetical protein